MRYNWGYFPTCPTNRFVQVPFQSKCRCTRGWNLKLEILISWNAFLNGLRKSWKVLSNSKHSNHLIFVTSFSNCKHSWAGPTLTAQVISVLFESLIRNPIKLSSQSMKYEILRHIYDLYTSGQCNVKVGRHIIYLKSNQANGDLIFDASDIRYIQCIQNWNKILLNISLDWEIPQLKLEKNPKMRQLLVKRA